MKLIQILRGFVLVALPCLLLCISCMKNENETSKNILTEKQSQAKNKNMDTGEGENRPPQNTKFKSEKVKPERKEESVDWSFWFSILSVGLSMGALYVAIRNNKKIKEYQKNFDKSLSSKSNSLKPSGIKDKTPDLLEKIKSIEGDVAKLKERMNKKKDESIKISQKQQEQQQSKVVEKEVQKTAPVEYGYFNQPVGGERAYFPEFLSESPRAIFKVEKRDNVATFYFLDHINIKQVVSADFLSSAIDLEGVLKQDAVNMTTTAKGQAEWKNDKWVITKKMVVLLS